MTDRTFYDALRAANTPLDFIHAVADQPLIDDPDGPQANNIDEQELLDERDTIIAKAREFQGALNGFWFADMKAAMDEARRILLGLSKGSRDDAVSRLERLIDRIDKA